ncbi:hypothetical protein [Demequina oxidasica]|uniref:hypothetical protein n=1 Tax=Demequina oxidasica TaxID=676199 RepID=UPI000780786E|nr:hypothetical protein [Demequina oxidasica]
MSQEFTSAPLTQYAAAQSSPSTDANPSYVSTSADYEMPALTAPVRYTAPAPTRSSRIGSGTVAAIVLGAVALAIGGSLLLTSLNASDDLNTSADSPVTAATGGGQTADRAAHADVRNFGSEVALYEIENREIATVTAEGREYVLSSPQGEHARLAITDGVEFGGWTSSSYDQWCMWVTAPSGDIKDFQMSSARGSGPGNCS